MCERPDIRRSLEEIEEDRWGPPDPSASRLVREAHRLRTVPVNQLTVEDLRLLIGQGIGLDVLVAVAIQRLGEDPLAEGDMYPGDLLVATLKVQAEFWRGHPSLHQLLEDMVAELTDVPGEVAETIDRFLERRN